MNSTLLKKAITELEKLSVDDQQALATRWLEEIRDEQIWASKFAATTDEQWNKLVEKVKQDIE